MNQHPLWQKVATRLRRIELDAVVVWLVWFFFAAALFWFIAEFAANVPFKDDFDHLEHVVGAKRLTLHWLWEPFYDHRVPASRLLWWVMAHLSNANYLVPTYFDAVLLIGIAAAWLVAMRKVRGAWSLWDVWIPVAVLHWGQFENLIWGHELALIGIAAVYTLMAWMALFGDVENPRVAVVWGVSSLVICGFCAAGVAYAAPMLVFLPLNAALLLRRSETRRAGLIYATSSLLLIVLVVAYRYGWKPQHGGATEDPHKILTYAWQLAGVAWSFQRGLWQINSTVTCLFVFVAIGAASFGVLVGSERRVWFGRLMLLGSFFALAAAMSWGRARSRDPFFSRYTTLLWPFVIYAYAVIGCKLSAAWLRVFGLLGVCLTAANLLPNWTAGESLAINQKAELDRVELLGLIGASPSTMGDLNLYGWQPPSMVTPLYALLKKRHQSFFGGSAESRRLRLGRLMKDAQLSDGAAPKSIAADNINVVNVDKRDVILLTAPSTMDFPIPRGRGQIHARFGVAAGGGSARFTIELLRSSGATTLWSAELDPGRVLADRGPHEVDVAFDVEEAATLRFATAPASDDSGSGAAWWTDLRLQPR